MDYVSECQSEVAKVGSTASVRNSVFIISHVAVRDCRVHFFSENLSRNSCMYDINALARLSFSWLTSIGGTYVSLRMSVV